MRGRKGETIIMRKRACRVRHLACRGDVSAQHELAALLCKDPVPSKVQQGAELCEKIARETNNPEFLVSAADGWARLDQHGRSFELMQRASDLGSATASFVVASAYDFGLPPINMRDWDTALRYYTIAAERGCQDALFNLGIEFCAQGRYADGLDMFERARRIIPDDPEVMFEIAKAHMDRARDEDCELDDDHKIRSILERSASAGFVPSMLLLYEIAIDGDDTDGAKAQAVRAYKTAAVADPGNESTQSHRAQAAFVLGTFLIEFEDDHKRGLKMLREAVRLEPTVAQYRMTLSREYEKRDEVRAAIDALLPLCELGVKRCVLSCSKLLMRAGELDEAIRVLRMGDSECRAKACSMALPPDPRFGHCPVCYDHTARVAMVPCGHCLCIVCSFLILDKPPARCPICRMDVAQSLVLHMA